jgi:hydrogenase maturation protein HypF
MLRVMVRDILTGEDTGVISRRFHGGVVDGFARMCRMVRESSGIRVAALSGGCFQNAFLLTELEARLRQDGFEVLSHEQVPANDGGVSLGQAVIANAKEQ